MPLTWPRAIVPDPQAGVDINLSHKTEASVPMNIFNYLAGCRHFESSLFGREKRLSPWIACGVSAFGYSLRAVIGLF